MHRYKSSAASLIRNAETDSRLRQIIALARQHDLAGKRFPIVLADIPWEGRVSWVGDPYPRLSPEQICQFRCDDGRLVRDVLADNVLVVLWVPDEHLYPFGDDPADAQTIPQIQRAWGNLRLRVALHWPKPEMSVGHYARYRHETCLVFTRGDFPPPEEHLRPTTLIVGPPVVIGGGFHFALPHDDRHSSKPDRLYEMIEAAYHHSQWPSDGNLRA